jgi:signal transduction histidine kinase
MTKILVIEDESILRYEVLDWLMFENYEAVGAEDGIAGLEMAFRVLPDLIISDITMPRLDGYGVLLGLHSSPMTAGIPFIFVTARATHDDVRRGMASGADDYITKPFTRMELLQAVESRLQKKAQQHMENEVEVDLLQDALAHEREERLLKAKLVAMFSHDFRTPLSSILSSVALLRDYGDRLDEDRKRMRLTRIEASVKLLTQMLDDLLLVMQMESGNLEFNPSAVQVDEFVRTIAAEFEAIYGQTHQVVFESHFSSDVLVDPRLIRTIMSNLISNAIKYSPQSSEVRVTLDQSNDHLVMRVRDQGIGIPEADQARIFEAFQRASNVADVQGTGLGLAIVKQATELHGGTASLESKVGVGTVVTVTLPIQYVE